MNKNVIIAGVAALGAGVLWFLLKPSKASAATDIPGGPPVTGPGFTTPAVWGQKGASLDLSNFKKRVDAMYAGPTTVMPPAPMEEVKRKAKKF